MTRLIDIWPQIDKVVILNHIIPRPDYISPSEWITFWDNAKENTERGERTAYLIREDKENGREWIQTIDEG